MYRNEWTYSLNKQDLIKNLLSYQARASSKFIMIKFSSGVDLLIHEVHTGLDETQRGSGGRPLRGAHHTSPREAGAIFAKAKPKLALYTHMIWGRKTKQDLIDLTRLKYNGPLVVGQEMMQLRIGNTVEVLK